MKVKILQKGGDKKHQETIENSVTYFAKMLMSTRMINTLDIRVEMRATKLKKGTLGICLGELNGSKSTKKFNIIVQRDESLKKQLETIAHEMVHVYQQATNKLQIRQWKSDGLYHARWDNKEMGPLGSIPYLDQSWEKEAYALESPLLDCFREHYNNRTDNEQVKINDFRMAVKKFDLENREETSLSM